MYYYASGAGAVGARAGVVSLGRGWRAGVCGVFARPRGRRGAAPGCAAPRQPPMALPVRPGQPAGPPRNCSGDRVMYWRELSALLVFGGAGLGQLVAPVPAQRFPPLLGRRATTVGGTVVAGK